MRNIGRTGLSASEMNRALLTQWYDRKGVLQHDGMVNFYQELTADQVRTFESGAYRVDL